MPGSRLDGPKGHRKLSGARSAAAAEAESNKVQKLHPPKQGQRLTEDEDKGRKTRNMHTQNQPIGQAPRHSSKAGANGGHPKPEGQDAWGTPRPRQTGEPRHTARLHSARLCATAIPLDPSPCGSSRPQNPHLPHPLCPLRPGTSPVGLPALGSPEAGLGRKAARVPPCARRGTGLDGKPRGSHPALEGVGCPGLLGPPPPASPAPVASLVGDPRNANRKSD